MARQLWLVFTFVLLLVLTAQADEGQWKTYTVADGLVSPDVTTIFQDRVGNLWFGTRAGGVSRFDGRSFRSFNDKDGLPGGFIRQILEDKQGYLWFIVTRGPESWVESLLCRYNGKTFHQVTEKDGLPGGVSDAVMKDKNDDLWIANKYGLTKYDGRRFWHFGGEEFKQYITVQSGVERQIHTIFKSQNGYIWLGGGARMERPGGPGQGPEHGPERINQRGNPFIIQYNGNKFQYFPLDSSSGSPFSTILAIEEDDAGNLWFGGRSVLLKYDGKSFEHFDSEKQMITAEGFTRKAGPGEVLITWKEPLGPTGKPLFVLGNWGLGPPGRIESDQSSVSTKPNVSKIEDKSYRYQYRTAGISIDSIFKDRSGHLWFNNRGFISRWDGKELRHFVIPENWGEIREFKFDEGELFRFYPGNLVLEDEQGNLWFKSSNGAHKFNGKTFQTFNVDDGLGSDNVSFILEAMDGKFWFGHDSGVTLFDPVPPVIQNFTTRAALGSNSIRSIYEDKQGFVWFSVRGGVARYDGEKLRYFSAEQMTNPDSRPLYTRSPMEPNFTVNILDGGKGIVWFVGGETHRIFRYKDGAFQRYSIWRDDVRRINGYNIRPGGFDAPNNRVSAVDPEGNLWFAVDEYIIRCDGVSFKLLTADGFQAVPPIKREGPPERRMDIRHRVTDIHVDNRGHIWFADGGDAVKLYDGTSLKTINAADGLTSGGIRKIFEDKQKNLWFAGEQAIMKYDGKSFQSFPVANVTAPPVAIYEGNDGSISFIYPHAVLKYDDGRFVTLESDKIQGEPPGNIMVRASASDNSGNLWLATSRGTIRYDGKQFTTYTTENGLLVNDVRDVLRDSQGNLWCATWGGGVALYNGENFQAITTKDGLVHNNVRSIHEDSHGNLWFATDGGITKYMLRTGILPRIKLTKVIAEGLHTKLDEELQLSAKTHRLVFEYQGVSLRQGKLLYTHKLEGYETDWSQPSTERQVQYDGLKPGSYTFLVRAFHEGSAYSNPPAFLQFTIKPPFWMQSQFYIPTSIGGLALVALIFLVVRLIASWKRTTALRAQLRQKEETEIQRVKKELSEAREMQMDLLPKTAPHIHQFELAGVSLPANEVGGDFYEYLTLGSNLVGIALADVSGKGLRGAMSAVMTNGMLHEAIHIESTPSAVLSRLNTDLYPLLRDSMFAALNFGILNPQTKKICYANAGQPYPIIKCNGKLEKVELGGLPLGLMAGVTYGEKTVDLNPGNYVIFYTDGITEAMNQGEEIYGFDRLNDIILNAGANLSAEEMIQYILQDVRAFVGKAEQYDDITVVVLRYIGT